MLSTSSAVSRLFYICMLCVGSCPRLWRIISQHFSNVKLSLSPSVLCFYFTDFSLSVPFTTTAWRVPRWGLPLPCPCRANPFSPALNDRLRLPLTRRPKTPCTHAAPLGAFTPANYLPLNQLLTFLRFLNPRLCVSSVLAWTFKRLRHIGGCKATSCGVYTVS